MPADMDAAIIAAGEGSRLTAGGISIPKPLVPIAGVPIFGRIVAALAASGVGKVHCIVNAAPVAAGIRELSLPIPVELTVRATPSSLHSLFVLAPHFDRPFLLATVDSIFDPSELPAFIDRGRSTPADALLAVTDFIDDENPLHVEVDSAWNVRSFDKTGSPRWVTGGIYILRPGIFSETDEVRRLGISRLRNFFIHLLAKGRRIEAFPFSKIVDVDRPSDILAAEAMVNRRPRALPPL